MKIPRHRKVVTTLYYIICIQIFYIGVINVLLFFPPKKIAPPEPRYESVPYLCCSVPTLVFCSGRGRPIDTFSPFIPYRRDVLLRV